jgi:hypothetical protein
MLDPQGTRGTVASGAQEDGPRVAPSSHWAILRLGQGAQRPCPEAPATATPDTGALGGRAARQGTHAERVINVTPEEYEAPVNAVVAEGPRLTEEQLAVITVAIEPALQRIHAERAWQERQARDRQATRSSPFSVYGSPRRRRRASIASP